MNQPSAFPSHESSTLNRASRWNPPALADSKDILPQPIQGLPPLTNFEALSFWINGFVLRSEALQSHYGTTNSRQAQDAQMARAVEDAIAAERNRLARELHDAVTQTLFAASLIAEVLPDLWDMDKVEAHKSTEELRQLTRGALAEMRTLLFELRPAALNQARLSDLLRQLSEAVMGRRSLPVSLDVSGDCEIPCDVKVEIYRIAQESLNNITKYARASRVDIKVQLETDHVHMEIRDNGVGFDPVCVKPTSLGLRIMRERADTIHAHLQVASQPSQGTTVSLDWYR